MRWARPEGLANRGARSGIDPEALMQHRGGEYALQCSYQVKIQPLQHFLQHRCFKPRAAHAKGVRPALRQRAAAHLTRPEPSADICRDLMTVGDIDTWTSCH